MNSRGILQRYFCFVSLRRKSSSVTIPALIDSYPIEATLFSPSISSSSRSICVVISEATGNRRQFYFPFAQYLSENHHFHVLTYDYRGVNVQKSTEWTLVDHWARRDCAGVLSYALKNYNEVVHFGHSLGGNMHAVLPASINEKLSRILLLSTANSYLMYHKWNPVFLRTLFLLYVIREPLNRLYGYYPMRRLFRTGADLPRNVIRQWARWTKHRECFVDAQGHLLTEGFNSVRCPVLALNFADDEFYTRQAFDVFTKQFQHALHLQTWHLPKGGHFNFFRQTQSNELWNHVAEFMRTGNTILPNIHQSTVKM